MPIDLEGVFDGRFKFHNHPVGADFRQDPDWKMNSLLVGQPGHLRGHAVGGTRGSSGVFFGRIWKGPR